MSGRPLCRHCKKGPVSRPRGLCWPCYYQPDIQRLYPPKEQKVGVPDGFGARPLPPEPTTARPGTPEKVAVLRRRAEQRCHLWHPEDA